MVRYTVQTQNADVLCASAINPAGCAGSGLGASMLSRCNGLLDIVIS